MLVPAMTLEDIRREIEKELPIVQRKGAYVSHKLQRVLADRSRRQKVVRCFDYQSKFKNSWIYKIEFTKKEAAITFLIYYYGDRGLTAVCPIENDTLVYCTGHFFNRYNERKKLNLIRPNDIMRSFLEATPDFKFQNLTQINPGIFETFAVIDGGIALGTFYQQYRLYKLNTFIAADMMRHDQRELEAQVTTACLFKDELKEIQSLLPDLRGVSGWNRESLFR